VKEKNPGADLLMAVDWKALLKDQATGLADLPPASEIVSGRMETVTIAPRTAENVALQAMAQIPSDERTEVSLPGGWRVIAALVLCIAAVVGIFVMKRRPRDVG
jgi:hypothetical protein